MNYRMLLEPWFPHSGSIAISWHPVGQENDFFSFLTKTISRINARFGPTALNFGYDFFC